MKINFKLIEQTKTQRVQTKHICPRQKKTNKNFYSGGQNSFYLSQHETWKTVQLHFWN